nr:polynucleotide adenylyltransferase family protein [Tanacetum cinerariifolium]
DEVANYTIRNRTALSALRAKYPSKMVLCYLVWFVDIISRKFNKFEMDQSPNKMKAITIRRNILLSPIKPLFSLQGLYHKLAEAVDAKPKPLSEDDYLVFKPGDIDVSKWKKMDARSLGINRTMVPVSPYTVMHILRIKGFEAYLVGGCVRDLLLNRTPKDFDVITTADLSQISKQFHNCEVVGRRFPVCRVYLKGSVVEVSSFDTLAKDAEGKEKFLESQMPKGCDKLDLLRWKNSMHRDFTINSLFYDPFLHKIYDYNDGMKDLLELKLRTLGPAQLSFTEDCARILRGLRIAARLGLSLSTEIKSAILKHRSSISQLGEHRIAMELNYMLSYGAAESSLYLLLKYRLLDILLPYQAAYISQQETKSGQSSTMLMKLLSHLDKLVTCDHPSASRLWVGLLGFHLALVENPQHPFIILTFACALYHQSWDDGLKFARKNSLTLVNFERETLEPSNFTSDDEVAEKVNKLAMAVMDSIDLMAEADPDFPNHGLVCIPQYVGNNTKQLFHVLAHKVETYRKGRSSFAINYDLLKKGDSLETRFVLGKIILNTMGCVTDIHLDSELNKFNNHAQFAPGSEHLVNKKENAKQQPKLNLQLGSAPKKQEVIAKLSNIMQKRKDQNVHTVQQDDCQEGISKLTQVAGISSDPTNEDPRLDKPEIGTSETQMQELICMLETITYDKKSPSHLESQNLEARLLENTEVKVDQLVAENDDSITDNGKSPLFLDSQNLEVRLEENSEVKVDQLVVENDETITDNEKYPLHLESQNLEVRLAEHTVVKVDDLVQQNDETDVSSLAWCVQANFKRAVEESRDSHDELRKLNQLLVNFLEEQVERKNAEQLEASSLVSSIATSQTEYSQLEAYSWVNTIGCQQIDSDQLEASSLVSSSVGTSEADNKQLGSLIVTSQTESMPQIRVQRAEKPKTTRPKNGERKKQRVCSYCKEEGHNKTGCPKRKIEEASCLIATEAT